MTGARSITLLGVIPKNIWTKRGQYWVNMEVDFNVGEVGEVWTVLSNALYKNLKEILEMRKNLLIR